MGLHFGGFGVNLGALLAREPLNMRVNPLKRTKTLDMRLGGGTQAHVIGPACGLSGQRADERAHMRRMRSQNQKRA